MQKQFFLYIIFFFTIGNVYPQDTIPEYALALSKFIQKTSLQYHEREAGIYFLNLCKEKGLHIRLLDTANQSMNFAASLYPLSSGKPNLILLNHLDVVSAGDTLNWKYPPFSGIIKDHYVWGRGAIDNKGMAIAELFAVSKFLKENKQEELPFNVSILSVSDEEKGGKRGAIPIAKNYLHLLNPFLMLGEGGSGVRGVLVSDSNRAVFGTSTLEKSRLILKLDLTLKSSGHGSMPPKEYATKAMVIALEKLLNRKQEIIFSPIPVQSFKTLGKAEKGLRGFILRNLTFFAFKPIVKKEIKKDPMISPFFTNTIALTNLSALNTDQNQISNRISAILDCRLIPTTETKQFIRQVKHKLSDRRIKISILHEERTGKRTIIPSYYMALSKALEQVYPNSLKVEIIFPATTDNYIFRMKGVPVFGLFPAVFTREELKSTHTVNEKIHIDRLTNGIKAYFAFLNNIKALKQSDPENRETGQKKVRDY